MEKVDWNKVLNAYEIIEKDDKYIEKCIDNPINKYQEGIAEGYKYCKRRNDFFISLKNVIEERLDRNKKIRQRRFIK